jgi:hypothetical protein
VDALNEGLMEKAETPEKNVIESIIRDQYFQRKIIKMQVGFYFSVDSTTDLRR